MRFTPRIRTTLLAVLAVAAVLLTATQLAFGQSTSRILENPVLTATAGPGFTITLTTADGKPVTTLVEGTYTINVSDKSANHNFHLFGPGLNQTTTVPEMTDTTWTVTLQPGGYAFVCDPHQAGGMRGTFSVVPKTNVAAQLTPKQVVGTTTNRRGSGNFTGTVARAADGTAMLTWKVTFRGLTGPALAAHVHAGLPGVSGPIAIPLCTACKSGATGTATVPAAALPTLLSGRGYVNVHTKKNGGGEIRGQVSIQG
jgi:plastocyanin